MAQYGNQLVIAGMGKTGKSVARYLDMAGVSYDVCDDAGGAYPLCLDMLGGYSGHVVKSPGIDPSAISAGDDAIIINDVELFLRQTRKPVIMVTGTNGKSTVVSLLEHILRKNQMHAIACGNNGVPVLEAFSKDIDLYVLELSSYLLENMSTLTTFSSVVLNIGVDHVDRYRDLHEYGAVKQRVYSAADVRVYPVDDNARVCFDGEIAGYAAEAETGRVVFSARGNEICRNGQYYFDSQNLHVLGRHNQLNVCAALALTDQLALDNQQVKSALASFVGLPHRMELVCLDSKGRKWVNDSKSTNVHALQAALSAQPAPVCLIVGGRGKGEDYSAALDQYAGIIGKLIMFGEDAGIIDSQAAGISNRVLVTTVAEAVAQADTWSADILFSPACASFDQYRDYIDRGEDFRQQVKRRVGCQAPN